MTDYRKYWIIKDGKACGPMPREALNGLAAETKVWRQGLPQWIPAAQLPELADLIARRQQPPVLPQPPMPEAPATEPITAPISEQATEPTIVQVPYVAPKTHLTAAIIIAAVIFLLFFFFLSPFDILTSPSFYILLLSSLLSIRSALIARRMWLNQMEDEAKKRNDRTIELIVVNIVLAITLFPFHVVCLLFF